MNIASYIDHTALKADCTIEDVKKKCREAIEFQFKAVCIPPYFVNRATEFLNDTPVKVATVVGFPMGYSATPAKVEEIKRAIDNGADEIDVVANICAVKGGQWNYVRNDIESMTMAVHLKGKLIKVILETGLLSDEEVEKLCQICAEVKVDFVKTSTGFNGEGATVRVVSLMRSILPKEVKIKASGGIRTKEDAIRLIEAGASRLGSSSGVLIIKE